MSMAATNAFFKAESVEISTKDILSWIFDEIPYPLEKKVFIDAEDPNRFVTAAEARTTVRKLVKGLRNAGFQKGDCVAIRAMNSEEVHYYKSMRDVDRQVEKAKTKCKIYYPVLVLGIIAAGGVFTGINPAGTHDEVLYFTKLADAKFFFTEPEFLTQSQPAIEACGITSDHVWIFNHRDSQKVPTGQTSWNELLTQGEDDWVRFNDERTQRDTTAMRLFSSGTTGKPKAVELTHRNLVAEHELGNNWKRAFESVVSVCLPMFHAGISPYVHTGILQSGNTSYILRTFDLELYLSTIEKYGVTEMNIVPTIVKAIVMSPVTPKYSLKSVRMVLCGSAPTSKELAERLKRTLGGEDLVLNQVYGMTESTCIAMRLWYPENDTTGSIGKLIPCMEAKIVDDTGLDISDYDVQGELCMRGPTITKGYFRNEEANAQAFDADGFYHTGDIVYCAKETKKWYIVDRVKEIFKVQGKQVSPAELEGILLEHPSIIDAAVIGIPALDEVVGEIPRAYVVLRPGTKDVSEGDVKEWVKQRVSQHKALVGGVRFIDAIPKNGSGKILKTKLKEAALEETRKTSA